MDNKAEQVKCGLEYAKTILNTITVSGIDNCQKISAVYNNIDVLLSMLAKGEIVLADNTASDNLNETANAKQNNKKIVKGDK